MAHLAARTSRRLSVQVKLHGGKGQRRGPVRFAALPEIAKKIGHRRGLEKFRRTERQPADRAHLLLELARPARVEREMARVVRPRRDLVDEQPAVTRYEELDAEDADVLERVHHAAGRFDRERRDGIGHARGRDRDVQNVPVVRILDRTKMRPVAADAARADD